MFTALLLAGCAGDSDDDSDTVSTPETAAKSYSASEAADKPYFDPIAYGTGPDDSISDTQENAAITHHEVVINGQPIRYTATAGHLVTYDPSNSLPSAKIFYVAYTADGKAANSRPVTFFHNGGPGSAAVYLLLGSYAPKRIKTSALAFTPPAPYTIETNPDSLLDKSDLVFINPVGTGYSTAIAPNINKDFWGVDKDTISFKQFIKRYLTANSRWNSPKFLFGESYGAPRSAVLAYKLHEDGIDLNGIVLLSSVLDYTQINNPIGLLPTYAANAWYHKKINVHPVPQDLPSFMEQVTQFARGDYEVAIKDYVKLENKQKSLQGQLLDETDPVIKATLDKLKQAPQWETLSWNDYFIHLLQNPASTQKIHTLVQQLNDTLGKLHALPASDDAIAQKVSDFIGIDKNQVKAANLVIDSDFFNRNLLPGLSIGTYDGRFTTTDEGIASDISLINNDAFNRAVNGVYIAAWNVYLNQELKYTSNSAFTGIGKAAHQNWDWTHIDPTKKITKTSSDLNTTVDLAAIMSINPDLRVFQASGYYDQATPWYQTRIDLQNMRLDPKLRKNLYIKEYPSGHMLYLDPQSRTLMKADLVKFFEARISDRGAMQRILRLQQTHQ